jgi:hypothetical protein
MTLMGTVITFFTRFGGISIQEVIARKIGVGAMGIRWSEETEQNYGRESLDLSF